jgi:Flp pilus assembly protein TadB
MAGLRHPTLPYRVERMHRRLDSGDHLLVYGLGMPLLLVVAWVAALAVADTPWLVAPIAVLVAAVVLVRAARRARGTRRQPPV